METYLPIDLPAEGKLGRNIAHFARALRKVGLPIGPGRIIDAIQAVQSAGFTQRDDFFWTLHACFVSRPEHRPVFAQVFRLFWRDPRYLEHMMSLVMPAIRGVADDRIVEPGEKRAAEALLDGVDRSALPATATDEPEETRLDIDATATASPEERLRNLDFEQMTTAEVAEAKRMLARMTLPVAPLVTRRHKAAPHGTRIDLRRTLRDSLRRGGEIGQLARTTRGTRWPNLVVLCDISGSMAQYSRMVLHFLHAVSNARGQGWAHVHGFTFGTRLTNITRHLATRDVDQALALAGGQAQDWSGGTRIGDCLHRFNQDWSRRVLGQGAVVLIITDGLDLGDPAALAHEIRRLQLSARRLVWLNPLLRWDGFAPRATGIQTMLPHVDSFRAGHNITSLAALADAISDSRDTGEKTRLLQVMQSG